MPKPLSPGVRSLAAALAVGFAVAAGVALADRDWWSAFLLADLAALCAYAVWKGKDPVAPEARRKRRRNDG